MDCIHEGNAFWKSMEACVGFLDTDLPQFICRLANLELLKKTSLVRFDYCNVLCTGLVLLCNRFVSPFEFLKENVTLISIHNLDVHCQFFGFPNYFSACHSPAFLI